MTPREMKKEDIRPGLYVYWTGDAQIGWDWARVFTRPPNWNGLVVEFVDPCGKTDLKLQKDGRDDRSIRLKFRALDRFPYTLYGPVGCPDSVEARLTRQVDEANEELLQHKQSRR